MDNEAQIKRLWDALDRFEQALEKSRKESDERMARIEKKYGGLSNNLGEELEIEFAEALRAKGQIGNAKLHDVWHRARKRHEYDLVALNDTAVFVGEIKQKLLPQDVERFVAERLPHFADEFSEEAEGRKVYGMVGGGNIVPDAKKLAKKHGLILLTLEGRALQTDNTEHARPV